jgi:hypothetical protein
MKGITKKVKDLLYDEMVGNKPKVMFSTKMRCSVIIYYKKNNVIRINKYWIKNNNNDEMLRMLIDCCVKGWFIECEQNRFSLEELKKEIGVETPIPF